MITPEYARHLNEVTRLQSGYATQQRNTTRVTWTVPDMPERYAEAEVQSGTVKTLNMSMARHGQERGCGPN